MDQNGLFRPKWTKIDHFGPFWSCECQNPVRNKVILTKMVVCTILDHFGPVHFPTVLRPFPRKGQVVDLGSGPQKRPKCLQNKGKANKTTIALISLIGLTFHQNDDKNKGKKNAKRRNGSIFARPRLPP